MWTNSQLKSALAVVDDGQSMKRVAQEYDTAYSSLRDWCYGKTRK